MIPQRSVEDEHDRSVTCRQPRERCVEPAQLRLREPWLNAPLAIFGVEDHHAHQLEFNRVVKGTHARAVRPDKRAVIRIARSAHEIVVPGGRVEGNLQSADERKEIGSLAFNLCV